MKVLRFECKGQTYVVSLEPDTLGQVIERYGWRKQKVRWGLPHPSWRILGVSFHHWRRGIDVHITPDVDPESLRGGLVWDLDHGTTRQWGGQYNGRLPRITWAVVEEIEA